MTQSKNEHLPLRIFKGILLPSLFAVLFLLIFNLLLALAAYLATLVNSYGDAMSREIFTTEIVGIGILFFILEAIKHYWKTKKAAK